MSMEQAYTLAAHAVRARLEAQHPADVAILDRIAKRDVTVLSGTYDSVQEVLKRLRVPFRKDPRLRGLGEGITFANCGTTQKPKIVEALPAYVSGGGWLVSSDWALENTIARAFPGTIRKGGRGNSGDEVVGVEPEQESAWGEVVVIGVDPLWWLEGGSYPIEVLDPERVRVEARSHELMARYGESAVAVRFDWGRGHVFHVISHFWLKRTRTVEGRHAGPAADFMSAGMGLDEATIARVFRESKVKPEGINFASIQSAVTSTELVARLCVEAMRSS